MRPNALLITAIAMGIASFTAQANGADLASFQAARKAYDTTAMATARDALIAQAETETDQFDIQFAAAECLRITGSELRTKRQTQRLPGKAVKELKAEQESWSEKGIVFAERALALATTEDQRAAAHRVFGELYANSITGMVSGLRNGPKARTHMDEALARTPKDPECQRAIGIMYLNNPPFNGGDVNKAIETFTACHNEVPENDVYVVLLAMAYQKNKNWDKAMEAADGALKINPANPNAAALKEAIATKTEPVE